ncbi:origin recognition complex subunit 5 C-terminus-domain-containing protein [Podospora aff. communis PSN243]|uniref:Origin recognition complex subunit 5 C-terminus-domain-containing protein n=1 Tax=Podospora aff. communis PSN243 TaxID=3040156 RepID=A0AAV9H787_9PEZI|nr:origin recognition complex subunit 5 C-terminus-domain-containing protein [Podospora aff. communis PSN243]
MSNSLFQLPDELLFSTLSQTFPCRDAQIRALATLLHPTAAPSQNLVIYGTEATGKSAITSALLAKLGSEELSDDEAGLKYAIVNSIECITSRHLFESVVAKVATALKWDHPPSKCESLSQLTVGLSKMLKYTPRPDGLRFVLVFDGIDRQREAPPTLLPALARLSEIIPCLTSVFIVTSPSANFLRTSFAPHLHFPNYTKPEFVAILSTAPPPPLPNTTAQETTDLWSRFTAAVHDALARAASRSLPSIQDACTALWPRFTAPILAGTHTPREFSKLLVASRIHFQDERLLDPSLTTTTTTTTPTTATLTDLASLLPTTARLLLLSAYLASHNPTRHDLTLFSTHHHGRRRRRGGLSVPGAARGGHRGQRTKHRKIARKLLGAHAFVLERMMAIFTAVRGEWDSAGYERDGDAGADVADVGMAIATLASLRLLVRVGGQTTGGDPLDRGGKWRVNCGWEVVRGLGRSMGVEVEEWLVE